MSILNNKRVGLVVDREATGYPGVAPYHPATPYPEYPFRGIQGEQNWAYELVRRLFRDLGLDASRFGRAAWNPLGQYIAPGDTVLLKPNLVAHRNWGEAGGLTDTDGLITHGSVIRAVADYVYIALEGRGRIVLGDSPVQATDWAHVSRLAGLDHLAEFYREQGLRFETKDFRLVVAHMEHKGLIRSRRDQNLAEDYIEVDLKDESLLLPIIRDADRFAVSGYGFGRMRHAHVAQRNLYLLPRVVLEADSFINIPKLKFHQKAGVTCALKNLVGINGHKDYLPHFRMGIDEYPPGLGVLYRSYWSLQHLEWNQSGLFQRKFLRLLGRIPRQFFPREDLLLGQGAWYGNDTLWRTVLDINRAFFYYNVREGDLTKSMQRKYFIVVDGIIGGERESPLSPTPVVSSCILGGGNPAAVDAVAVSFMGLDPRAIPQVTHAFDTMEYPLVSFRAEEIEVVHSGQVMSYPVFSRESNTVSFSPSAGWRGHVERTREGASREGKTMNSPSYDQGMDEAGQQGFLE